ncbi:MAG: PepSY domain-containing protein [Gammaproteobacteria bacterium]
MTKTPILALAMQFLGGCGLFSGERNVPLSEVPPNVLSATKGAVPGLLIDEIELEEEDGVEVWEFEGMAGGKRYEVEISASGEVLEVEEVGDD